MYGHQDPNFNDRKLKPIYDYLEIGCYKKALQEIDKVLKKSKNQQYVKVLKSLTLTRMGRQKDASEILDSVFNENPTDDSTLQTMSMCYRETDRSEMISAIYENALKNDPSNEKLHAQLFMAYVRLQDYKKQQLSALNLYKVHPKPPYYFWAVMSIYMQSFTSDNDDISIKIILPLAEKMCQKALDTKTLETESQVRLFMMILEKQKKYSAMIDLIESCLKSGKLPDHLGFVQYEKVKLFKLVERYEDAFECLVELIRNNNDQYDYYIEAFKVATLIDNKSESEQKDFEYTFRILDLTEEMCALNKTTANHLAGFDESNVSNEVVAKRVPRGPFIAKIIILELIKKSVSVSGDQIPGKIFEKIPSLKNEDYIIDLISDYFDKFGSKYVCFKDLIYIFHNISLSRDQAEKLLVKIKFSLLSIDKENDWNEIYKSLIYYCLSHYYQTNLSSSIDERVEQSKMLMELYKKSLSLIRGNNSDRSDKMKEKALNQKEQQPFDPFINLFVNKIFADIDIYQQPQMEQENLLFDMIVFLQWSNTINKNDFYVKLMLIRLCNSIGAAFLSHELYQILEIKLIQNDTLGHFFLKSLLTSGLYSYAKQFLETCWKFYTYNCKDASDYIISCYKFGSFTKIEEILSFNYKLENSIQYHLTFVERLFLNLLLDCKNHLTFTNFANENLLNGNFDINWEKICDNRDLQLLSTNHFEFESLITEKLHSKTFSDEVLWLRYRIGLMRCLLVAQYLAEQPAGTGEQVLNGNTKEKADSQLPTAEEFVDLLERLKEISKLATESATQDTFKYYLEGPEPSRLIFYFKQKYSFLISTLLNYLGCLFKTNKTEECQSSEAFATSIAEICDEISNSSEKPSLYSIRTTLEHLSGYLETVSICISLIDVCDSQLRKISKSGKRSKKKKPLEGQTVLAAEAINTITSNLSTIRSSIDDSLKKTSTLLKDQFKSNIITVMDLQKFKLNLPIDDVDQVTEASRLKIVSSYTSSVNELIGVLQAKQKYLASLTMSANQPA